LTVSKAYPTPIRRTGRSAGRDIGTADSTLAARSAGGCVGRVRLLNRGPEAA
jgi:hypothetical protein